MAQRRARSKLGNGLVEPVAAERSPPERPARLVRAEDVAGPRSLSRRPLEQSSTRRRIAAGARDAREDQLQLGPRGDLVDCSRELDAFGREALGAVPPSGAEQDPGQRRQRPHGLHRPSAPRDRQRALRDLRCLGEAPDHEQAEGGPTILGRNIHATVEAEERRVREEERLLGFGRPTAHGQRLPQHVVRCRAAGARAAGCEGDAAPGEGDLLVDSALHPEREAGEVDDRRGTVRLVLLAELERGEQALEGMLGNADLKLDPAGDLERPRPKLPVELLVEQRLGEPERPRRCTRSSRPPRPHPASAPGAALRPTRAPQHARMRPPQRRRRASPAQRRLQAPAPRPRRRREQPRRARDARRAARGRSRRRTLLARDAGLAGTTRSRTGRPQPGAADGRTRTGRRPPSRRRSPHTRRAPTPAARARPARPARAWRRSRRIRREQPPSRALPRTAPPAGRRTPARPRRPRASAAGSARGPRADPR